MRYCVIEKANGLCVNIIELDSSEQFHEHPTHELAPDNTGEIGWLWSNSEWHNPADNFTDEDYALAVRTKRDRLLKKYVDRINYMRWSSMSQKNKLLGRRIDRPCLIFLNSRGSLEI